MRWKRRAHSGGWAGVQVVLATMPAWARTHSALAAAVCTWKQGGSSRGGTDRMQCRCHSAQAGGMRGSGR